MMFLFAGTLIRYHTHTSTQTHTERDTAHPGASRLTIYALTALCSQQLSLLY